MGSALIGVGLLLFVGAASAQDPGAHEKSGPYAAEALRRVQAAREAAAAVDELEHFAQRLQESGFGLEVPHDLDAVLAASTALSALAARMGWPEVLLDYLRILSDACREYEAVPSELALALAQGWIALLSVGGGSDLEREERIQYLEQALELVTRISVADRRDSWGCQLAEHLFIERKPQGLRSANVASLEANLVRCPDDHLVRLRALTLAAEARYRIGDMAASWRDIELAEQALEAARSELDEVIHAKLERTLAAVRFRWEFASGLFTEARDSLERERAAVSRGAQDEPSLFSLWQDTAACALAIEMTRPLDKVIAELDAVLADTALFADRPDHRAVLRALRARLELNREQSGGGKPPRARELMGAALADAELDSEHRSMLGMNLFDSELAEGSFARAGEILAEVERGAPAQMPVLQRRGLVARRALLALERGDSKALLMAPRAELVAEYQEYLSSWADTPIRSEGLGYLAASYSQLLLGALTRLEVAIGGPEAGSALAFEHVLRFQALGSLGRQLGVEGCDLSAVQAKLLGHGSGALCYVSTGQDAVDLYCLEGATLVRVPITFGEPARTRARELRGELARSPAKLTAQARVALRKRVEALAQELARTLLPGEIQARVRNWKGVYVVGAGFVGNVPFEALPLTGEPLGLSHALAYLPSFPVGLALARRDQGSSDGPFSVLSVAVTRSEYPEIDPIPVTRTELEALAKNSSVLIDGEASLAELQGRLKAAPVDALNLVAHGRNDPGRENEAGLYLPLHSGSAETLWGSDLLGSTPDQRFASPRLVVLSVCHAARGPMREGDDGLGYLAGSFMLCGAVNVVQAPNEIALAPTLTLVRQLFAGIEEQATPAEALRRAREVLASDPGRADPHYVFSLQLVGLGLQGRDRNPR